MNSRWIRTLLLSSIAAGGTLACDDTPASEGSSGGAGGAAAPSQNAGGAGGAEPGAQEGDFTLVEQTPAPGDDIWLRSPIEITLSQPVDGTTADADSIQVFAGEEKVRASVTLTNDDKTVRIVLDESPTAPTEITVRVSSDLLSSDGEQLAESEWTFNAPEWVALEPLDLQGELVGTMPPVATDGAGNVVVSWNERHPDFDDRYNLYVSRWRPSGWKQIGDRISKSGLAREPDLALRSSGEPVLSYLDGDGLFVSSWEKDAWQQVGERLQSGDIWTQKLVLDAEGDPWVAWSEFISGYGIWLSLSRWNGTDWFSHRVTAVADSHMAILSDIEWDGQGSAMLSFSDEPEPSGPSEEEEHANHFVKAVAENGVDESLGSFDDSGGRTYEADLALDADGRPWVAYRFVTFVGGPLPDVTQVKYWDGENWVAAGSPLDADGSDETVAHSPQLLFDRAGQAIVAWTESDQLHLRRWTGSTWEPIAGQPLEVGSLTIDDFDGLVIAGPGSEATSLEIVRQNR